jgi:membrane peptidoglycan carboxypeptidase
VLGAQPVRPVDLAAFYAAIANEGTRPEPHVIDSIEHDGRTIYRHDPQSAVPVGSVDRAAFYQLKSMLQGVLARGTARSMAGIAPFVAGKTGTSDEENDAWFVGFTNDVTVAVWVGYDNAGGKRRTLGGGATGGHTAVPIFEPVMQAVWAHVAPRAALAPPSPEARRQLSCKAGGGEARDGKRRRTSDRECLRVDARGKVLDTQYRLLSRESSYASRNASRKTRKAESRETTREATRDSRTVRTARKARRAPTQSYSNNWGWSQGWGWSSGWQQYYGSWNRW